MQLVSKHIRHMAADTSCHQFCVGVTAAIRRRYRPFLGIGSRQVLQQLAQHPEERLTASAVVYSRRRRELWFVGDCQALVGGVRYENPKPYEERLAAQRAREVQRLLAAGKSEADLLARDEARAAIIPQMLQEMQQQNVTYAVIDGFPIPEAHVPVLPLNFQPWEIVLASDGYPFLCPTLAESEERLQQQAHDDPLNIGTFKATKAFTPGYNSFDDRCYIRFKV